MFGTLSRRGMWGWEGGGHRNPKPSIAFLRKGGRKLFSGEIGPQVQPKRGAFRPRRAPTAMGIPAPLPPWCQCQVAEGVQPNPSRGYMGNTSPRPRNVFLYSSLTLAVSDVPGIDFKQHLNAPVMAQRPEAWPRGRAFSGFSLRLLASGVPPPASGGGRRKGGSISAKLALRPRRGCGGFSGDESLRAAPRRRHSAATPGLEGPC